MVENGANLFATPASCIVLHHKYYGLFICVFFLNEREDERKRKGERQRDRKGQNMAEKMYYPNSELAKEAHCSSMEEYKQMHER